MMIGFLILATSFSTSIKLVEASGTIYIGADGSINPPTTPLQQIGDIYRLTGNVNGSIVVERDSIWLMEQGISFKVMKAK